MCTHREAGDALALAYRESGRASLSRTAPPLSTVFFRRSGLPRHRCDVLAANANSHVPNPSGAPPRWLVASLKPAATDYTVWDTAVPGFGCRVWPSGTRTYLYRYRVTGQRRLSYLSIDAGDTDAARVVAERHQVARREGRDPASERQALKGRPSVATLGADYLEHVRTYRKATTATEYVRLWEKHVAPKLGRLIVAEVTAADVSRLHRGLAETPYVANRVLELVGAFLHSRRTRASGRSTKSPVGNQALFRKRVPKCS